jgi:uncharacterized phage protein (TIGR02218 family)
MKAVSPALAAHLAGEATTLATLWRVVRRDGAVFTFTDHDRDIAYGSETYAATLGYQRAAISTGASLAVDETELLGLLDSAAISEADLRSGLWDHAEVRIFAVNWADLGQGELKLRRGRLGEVTVQDDGSFRAELRGLAQPLQQTIGAIYQPECRADLGDARCGIDLALGAGWTQQAAVEAVADGVTLVMSAGLSGFPDGWFEGGVAIWQGGANAGVAREVVAWDQATRTLVLFTLPPYPAAPGDVLRLQPGCDKRWDTCRLKFANRLNFRGEPLIPGPMAALESPT